MSVYKLITFDITGTVLKFKRPIGRVYTDLAALYGVESDGKIVESNFRKNWVKFNVAYPNYGRENFMDWQDWWKKLVIESFDGAYDVTKSSQREIEQVADHLIQQYATDREWHLEEKTAQMFTYLKGNDIKIGAISNFDPRLHNILACFNLTSMFDFILTSYEVGYMKPDVRLFMYAEGMFANQFGPIQSCEILHIGDSYENDFVGAQTAGWDAALVCPQNTGFEVPLSPTKILFSDLEDLRDHLERMSKQKKENEND